MTKPENYHEGKAIFQFTKTHVMELCPVGHLISAKRLDKTWAGSKFEADVSGEPPIVRCYGTMPEAN